MFGVKNNAFNRCLGCFLCILLSFLICTSFVFADSYSVNYSDWQDAFIIAASFPNGYSQTVTFLDSLADFQYTVQQMMPSDCNFNTLWANFISFGSRSGGFYEFACSYLNNSSYNCWISYRSNIIFNSPNSVNYPATYYADYIQSSFGGSNRSYTTNSGRSLMSLDSIINYSNRYLFVDNGGSFTNSDSDTYILDTSLVSDDWSIINIHGQSPIDTGTGLVIYSDIESSPYASRFQASPEIEVSHAFTQEDGDIVFYTTHFIDVKVDPSTGNLYTSTNYFGRSGSLGGSGFREGVLHTTSPVSPDGQWIATRNKDGLQIKKNVPFVVREGALLADSANKTLYFNDPSPSFPSSVTSVPTSSLYDLLLAWSKLNIASAQAAQAAISGVSAVLNDALYYTDTVSIGDESWSYSYSIADLVESIRYLLVNYFSKNLIEPRYISGQSYQSVLHALNLQYMILSSFEELDANGLPPQYIQVYGHRYDNPAYIVLGQLNDHFDTIATSIDNLSDALVGDGDVVFPDSDTTVQDDIFNTVLDPDSPISLQPGRVADAFNIMGDTSEFYTLDRPSFSFFSIFSNIDKWPLFTRETAANCGLDVDEDL